MKSKIFTTQLTILFLASMILSAQVDKTVKDKIKDIKGDISKIVVSTKDGDVIFEGDEAKEVGKMLKTRKMHKSMEWISGDDMDFDFDGENVMVFKSEKGGKHIIKKIKGDDNVMIFKHGDHDDFNILEDGKSIKVILDDENGNKKVTVTTNKDGEEKVEVYEGKEADEYLEKMKKDGKMIIDVEGDSDDLIWITEDGDMTGINKNVKVELKDGKQTVTVTTIENGEKKVEVFEGDEAEEYLKSENGESIKVKVKSLKDGKHKKIIIKEIEEEESE